jgi:hypothetical protein
MINTATIDDDALVIELDDGRSITAPLTWYPRLLHATRTELDDFRVSGGGRGIHWPRIEEDISVESVLKGQPSMESAASLKRWLEARLVR